ncbi:uncharacterized protein KY384_000179 [Bacidia gigantensis]|uniref:uncharacterized protein n=1 Tax=Bacidia gigantensis TaxID=2732470 RepID=UPI001D05104C|nr:uncharacterized protein KY384_000179 [Bacidia gigantensis]KAG8526186.1 hypothetical protein KY384_000179 [Bacidia gigantensis]
MPRRPRGKLVRWSTELNEKLLLAIQSGCNETGTVLPMDTIASHMNSNASPNAILQHLAKMRRKREEDGLQNPPPLRRGGRRYDVPSASTNSADQADTDSDPDYAVISSNKRAKTKPGANKAANPSAAPAASPKVGSRKAFVAASLPAVGGGEDLLFSTGFGAFSGGSFVVDDEMDMEEAGVFGGGPEWAW